MRKILFILIVLLSFKAQAQQVPYSQQLALTAMHIWPDSFSATPGNPARWSYDQGVILKGIEGIWQATGDAKWFKYIEHSMDHYVREDGSIKDYDADHYNIDHLNNGKVLLTIYRVTGKAKYKKAVELLRRQLLTHPRTKEGGFWHKQIYPWQMWLDGLYMGQPFYAEYAQVFGEDTIFNDVTKQFVLMEKNSRDPKTGLLYHGYDESREQQWADKKTGRSPHFWARALGWYGVAMVDALDYFPENHPGRQQIIDILKRFATAVVKVQDAKTGMWYDIVDLPNRKPNYLESSATAMLSYTLAKGARKGYIAQSYATNAKRAFDGLVKYQITKGTDGFTNLEGTVTVSGLGGKPYRDGSFDYYMREKVKQNDPKGMGAFILAANEIEMMPKLSVGKNKTVLDNYFNNEWQKGPGGQQQPFHYVWEERDNNGYYFLGHLFEQNGAVLQTLKTAPAKSNLSKASVYIIVDADTEKETAHPNYITEAYATTIADWVKAGGVLVLMGNNSGNAEQKYINLLAGKFGIKFNGDDQLMVKGSNYEQGAITIDAGNPIFKSAQKIYIKEISSLDVSAPAKTILKKEFNVMATAKHGKGTVFVLGDPWIYNEYVDGRKLPAEYQNFAAASDWVKWLLKNASAK
ncbi:glycoside hydrolase family 88 protein [Niabella ginsengisoli]|uniref:Glycoside hydrolase family 88 protein n=1 Tax=Niabella ginsengisoli TaxID=522298 RepID=A0ABS9SQN9_9BACT|nr:glycoside hydrolase family 88 protein [Niabella ginsengisoli]MCH5600719.1 glycoside hydrolase family 88 protein [Niabella ginsengisoli]